MPPSVLIIAGSPSPTSRTARLAGAVEQRLAQAGVPVSLLDLRSLPAEDLLHARFDAPAIVEATARVQQAQGIVLATPVYKAAYSGLLKCFLDLLPQFGLRNKVVAPLATGGSLAHVLAIDYAMRPVLSSMLPANIVGGLLILDKQITVQEGGGIALEGDLSERLDALLQEFLSHVHLLTRNGDSAR